MAKRMPSKRLTLRLEPAEKFVQLDVFVMALNHFRRAMKGLTSNTEKKVDWVVVDLKIGSAVAAIEPVGDPELGLRAVALGMAGVDALERREPLPAGIPDEFVDGMRDLADLGVRAKVRTQVGRGSHFVLVTRNLVETAEQLHEPESAQEFGSIEGSLEGINIHGSFECAIYTDFGGHRVVTEFEKDSLEKIKSALGKRVTARGTITTNRLGRPMRIQAETIEVLPADDELPSIEDMIGIAPEISGKLSTDEYIRRLREGDE